MFNAYELKIIPGVLFTTRIHETRYYYVFVCNRDETTHPGIKLDGGMCIPEIVDVIEIPLESVVTNDGHRSLRQTSRILISRNNIV